MSIALRNDNLFQTGQLEQFADGTEMLTRKKIEYIKTGKEQRHTIVEGETIRQIAYMYYKNMTSKPQNWWWIIADVNEIENPLFLSEHIGSTIIIPDLYQAKLMM